MRMSGLSCPFGDQEVARICNGGLAVLFDERVWQECGELACRDGGRAVSVSFYQA